MVFATPAGERWTQFQFALFIADDELQPTDLRTVFPILLQPQVFLDYPWWLSAEKVFLKRQTKILHAVIVDGYLPLY